MNLFHNTKSFGKNTHTQKVYTSSKVSALSSSFCFKYMRTNLKAQQWIGFVYVCCLFEPHNNKNEVRRKGKNLIYHTNVTSVFRLDFAVGNWIKCERKEWESEVFMTLAEK